MILWKKSEPPSGDFSRLGDRELTGLMFLRGDQLPRAWADEAISRGERLVPMLAGALLDERNWHRWDAGWCGVNHAAYLLGAIGGEAAIAPLVFALRQSIEYDDDWISESIPAIFGHLGPKALPYLREIALDKKAYWHIRDRAMCAMAAVALAHPGASPDVFPLIAAVAGDAGDDPEARVFAGHILLDFRCREHEGLLLKMVEEGVADGHFDETDVRRGLSEGDLDSYRDDWLDFYSQEQIDARRSRWDAKRVSEAEALREIADTEWGDIPDEADDGEDADADAPRPRDERTAQERHMLQFSRLLREKKFGSIEEANAYLRSVAGKIPPPTGPLSPWEQAQEMVYEARQNEDARERVAQARRALEVCPDCGDAYALLAEDSSKNPKEAVELYRKALRAEERRLGPDFFKENGGRFWGVIETRPYMRARADLAAVLRALGEDEAVLDLYRDSLRLNAHDNQGLRYVLLSLLGELGRFDEMAEFMNRPDFKDEGSADWLYTKALIAFKEGGAGAAASALAAARKANRHVPDYLLGRKAIPRPLPDRLVVGGESEAYSYADEFLGVWRRVPGALDWLGGGGAVAAPKIGRNAPCVCGSGRKFKKCCMDKPAAGRA